MVASLEPAQTGFSKQLKDADVLITAFMMFGLLVPETGLDRCRAALKTPFVHVLHIKGALLEHVERK